MNAQLCSCPGCRERRECGESTAIADQWNAWRYPTDEEVADGRVEWDVIWEGAADTLAEAADMLAGAGQVQWGCGGEVVNVDEHGGYAVPRSMRVAEVAS